jgi:two-component system sensor histidine kinase/response regulator
VDLDRGVMKTERRTVLDPDIIADLREISRFSGEDVFAELITLYFRDLPTRIESLRKSAESGDAAEFAKAAHALKGPSASLGAQRLATLCHDLEETGHTGKVVAIEPMLADLQAETEQLRMELERETTSPQTIVA